jgi:hypothetical protein
MRMIDISSFPSKSISENKIMAAILPFLLSLPEFIELSKRTSFSSPPSLP